MGSLRHTLPVETVDAYRRASGGLTFFCEYCGEPHYHGEPEGHREAHCQNLTPYTLTGYILRCVGEYTAEVKADFEQRRKEAKETRRRLRKIYLADKGR